MAQPATILFVDDEPMVLEGVRRMLRAVPEEWRLETASTVGEALIAARRRRPDVVVTDVKMPGSDGFDLLQAFGEDALLQRMPVVMLTGSGEADLKRRALDAGAVDLLSKPIERENLRARLRSVIALKRSQDEIRAYAADLERRVHERTTELARSRAEVIWRLATTCERRDDQTGRHVARVAHYSRILAETLRCSEAYSEQLFLASMLHDVGKVAIPDAILHKPGTLSPDERRRMQGHCRIGHALLSEDPTRIPGVEPICADNPLLVAAATIALRHHERWDGTGYPEGLSGESIPLEARIVALADVYDALTQRRTYKPAHPERRAREEIVGQAGAHFDPALVDAFRRSRSRFSHIALTLAEPDAQGTEDTQARAA